jgi:hypothetical protein
VMVVRLLGRQGGDAKELRLLIFFQMIVHYVSVEIVKVCGPDEPGWEESPWLWRFLLSRFARAPE